MGGTPSSVCTGDEGFGSRVTTGSVDSGCVELNYEIRLKEDSSAFVNELEAMPGISRVVLVSYNGDYMG